MNDKQRLKEIRERLNRRGNWVVMSDLQDARFLLSLLDAKTAERDGMPEQHKHEWVEAWYLDHRPSLPTCEENWCPAEVTADYANSLEQQLAALQAGSDWAMALQFEQELKEAREQLTAVTAERDELLVKMQQLEAFVAAEGERRESWKDAMVVGKKFHPDPVIQQQATKRMHRAAEEAESTWAALSEAPAQEGRERV